MTRSHELCIALAALILADHALAQTEVAWTHTLDAPAGFFEELLDVFPADDFGSTVVTSIRTGFFEHREVVVERLDENGDLLSAVNVPVDSPTTTTSVAVRAASDGLGRVAVIVRRSPDDSLLVCVEPDGTTSTVPLLPAVGSDSFSPVDVELHPGGDVFVCGSSSAGGSVLRLDATGGTVWRTDFTDRTPVELALDPNGTVSVVSARSDNALKVLERLDSAGAVVWSTNQQASESGQVVFAGAADTGYVYVATRANGAGSRVRRNSPTGVHQWNTQLPITIWFGAVHQDGGVVVSGRKNGRPYVASLDSSGNVRWDAEPPVVLGRVAFEVALGADGVTYVTGSEYPTSSDLPKIFVCAYDPAGALLWLRRFPEFDSEFEFGHRLSLDGRGQVLVSTMTVPDVVYPQFYWLDQPVRTVKVLEGVDIGAPYCAPAIPNSTGAPAEIRAFGTDSVATDDLTLLLTDLPPASFTFALVARQQGTVVGPGMSQGTLCLSGPIGRFVGSGQVRQADPAGQASLQVRLMELPTPTGLVPVLPGETHHFQAWYRDQNPAATSNFTSAVSVTFQ